MSLIEVLRKKRGEPWEVVNIEESAISEEVGGEPVFVTIATDVRLVYGKGARVDNSNYNVTFCGIMFPGTVLLVGVKKMEALRACQTLNFGSNISEVLNEG